MSDVKLLVQGPNVDYVHVKISVCGTDTEYARGGCSWVGNASLENLNNLIRK